MPRGRPRKNPVSIEGGSNSSSGSSVSGVNTNTESVSERKTQSKSGDKPNIKSVASAKTKDNIKMKADEKYPHCECCGAVLYTTPRRLNLMYLLGVASYRLNVKNAQINLCGECSNGLCKVVDDWLIEHGAEKKFSL